MEELPYLMELEIADDQIGKKVKFRPNKQNSATRLNWDQPTKKLMEKYEDWVNTDFYDGPRIPNSSVNLLSETKKRTDADRMRVRDKNQRATVEQVLDPRTKMILFKMLSRGIIEEVNGCISTGKEANVYHATCIDGCDKAIKIYRTSVLMFKDRNKYVASEFRFRHWYGHHNPRKMVMLWAEKEMRNLKRIYKCGLPCPRPCKHLKNVLVMEFIGKDGWPSPLLSEVEISESKARELYHFCVVLMRRLYNDCKLVHADLSEFNLIYHEESIYLIDVSQSVEHDHPRALEFLRRDCTNINCFFRKKNVATMTVQELFSFITDPNINNSNIDAYLERIQEIASSRTSREMSEQEKIEEEVFKHSYIPQRLDQVIDYENDIASVQDGQKVLYHTLTGMKADLSGPSHLPELLDESSSDDDDNDDKVNESDGEGSSDEKYTSKFVSSARPRDESPNSKKERKKAVKEIQREKRKQKMPKHIKKHLEKATRSGKR